MIVLPLIAAIAAATVWRRLAVRFIAVAVMALCVLAPSGGLIAPHRLAAERLGTPPSAEWDRGARDTRDVVYTIVPILASGFCALGLLALRPVRTVSGGG